MASTKRTLPVKSVVEYPLPAAAQTHEVLPVSDQLLLITQQTNGSLLKVSLDKNGRPTAACMHTITNQWSGLHGLTISSGSTTNSSIPNVWATVQFDNAILHIDPNGNDIGAAPRVIKTISIPDPASGPHSILEHGSDLWVTCKDSSHVVKINPDKPNEYQIWAVSRRPIFVAVHPTSGHVYSTLDMSSKIWHYEGDGKAGKEIAVPPEKGAAPVGMIAGPDGNLWFVLVGNQNTGTGTFGRINKDSSINWFTLTSAIGATAPLIHLAFCQDPSRLWLLGSSIASNTSPDAVYTVKIDDLKTVSTVGPRIAIQNTTMMPTQRSRNHRIIFHRGGLYVTELTTSTLAHITGADVDGFKPSESWDQFALSGLGLGGVRIDYDNPA